jgi:hypothetical protein
MSISYVLHLVIVVHCLPFVILLLAAVNSKWESALNFSLMYNEDRAKIHVDMYFMTMLDSSIWVIDSHILI